MSKRAMREFAKQEEEVAAARSKARKAQERDAHRRSRK